MMDSGECGQAMCSNLCQADIIIAWLEIQKYTESQSTVYKLESVFPD